VSAYPGEMGGIDVRLVGLIFIGMKKRLTMEKFYSLSTSANAGQLQPMKIYLWTGDPKIFSIYIIGKWLTKEKVCQCAKDVLECIHRRKSRGIRGESAPQVLSPSAGLLL